MPETHLFEQRIDHQVGRGVFVRKHETVIVQSQLVPAMEVEVDYFLYKAIHHPFLLNGHVLHSHASYVRKKRPAGQRHWVLPELIKN